MSWLLPRWLAGVLAVLLGGGLGYVLGSAAKVPTLGLLVGGGVAVALAVLFDTLRGYRLVRWLRGAQQQDAPRGAGLWGELGYRVERALRSCEREAALERDRLAQFLRAIEAAPNGVLLLDESGRIDWCNSMAAEHLGLDPQRDRGQPLTNLVRAPAFVAHLQAERFEEAVVFQNPRRPGTLSVTVRPYADNMLLVLSQDITEIERTDAMRRDFVANVSHEIRTPLTVLAGSVDTLADLPLTEVERKRVLDLMRQQTQRMQLLVGDLLTLAQIEGSPQPPTDRWVDLDGLLARVDGDARALSKGRHDIVVARSTAIRLAGAETELYSAVANVVGNAVRYTPERGRIEIAWVPRADGGGTLEVRDTGIGIAAQHLPRLCERFYRVDGSRSRDTGGTGLGLSIVKHVLQRHGGELDVRSEPARGSVFSLVFPSARVRQGGAHAG